MMKKLLFCLTLLPALSFGQLLTEDFESVAMPPSGWNVVQTNTNETWVSNGDFPINGSFSASVDYDEDLGQQNEMLISPSVDLSTATVANLRFTVSLSYYWSIDPNDNYDVFVRVSTDGGTTWTNVWDETQLGEFDNFEPYIVDVDLSEYAGQANVKVAFQYVGSDGAQLIIDDIALYDTAAPCDIGEPSDVEPITLVQFAGINNVTDAEVNGSPVLEDFTDQFAAVEVGGTYPIVFEGNTGGDWTDYFTAFFDWNNDGDYNDEGERYDIGSVDNSTGVDGVQATGTIAVPVDATTGTISMRVIKYFNDFVPSACNFGSDWYGQIEEYSVTVSSLHTVDFDRSAFKAYPNPTSSLIQLSYEQPISQVEFYNVVGQKVFSQALNATDASVNISELTSGTYLMKVNAIDGSSASIKVVRQ